MGTPAPKILHLDVEAKPALARVWRPYDETISPDQVVSTDSLMCWAAKWHGSKGVKFSAEWDDPDCIPKLRATIEKADAVVTYNGDKYDLPKIRGALVRANLPPLPPVTSIDLYKVVKRFGFFSGKLAFVGPLLGVGAKVKHHGFGLWRDVIAGDKQAQRLMRRYNIQDVNLLEDLYVRIRPYMDKHPALYGKGRCPNCGGGVLLHSRYKYTRTTRTEILLCQGCGAYHSGKVSKL